MKTRLLALIALFSILVSFGCQKKPSASFTTNKETYNAGENVICTDQSSDAYSINWIVRGPTEFRSTGSSFTFVPQLEGDYEITQACYSKNTNKVSKTSKNIAVTRVDGQYTFYSDYIHNSRIRMYVDGGYIGDITQEYNSAPTCNAATGCVRATLSFGNHTIDAVVVSLGSGRTYTITANQQTCNTFLISI